MESWLYIDLIDTHLIILFLKLRVLLDWLNVSMLMKLCTFYRQWRHSKYASIKSKYNKSYGRFDNPQ